MQVVCEIQRICIMTEKSLIGAREVRQRLEAISAVPLSPLAGGAHGGALLRCLQPAVWR